MSIVAKRSPISATAEHLLDKYRVILLVKYAAFSWVQRLISLSIRSVWIRFYNGYLHNIYMCVVHC